MDEGLWPLVNWCMREKLRVNAFKTVIIPFTHKRKGLEQFCSLRINGKCVTISGTVKYRGITLDSKITWNEHLSSIVHKG